MKKSFDVVVVGGGLSGVCAALAAARSGAATAIVESRPFVGGNGTIGLPMTSFRARRSSQVIVRGIPLELLERLRAKGGFDSKPEAMDWMPVDCEKLQIVLAELLVENSVSVICHAPLLSVRIAGSRIVGLTLLGKDDPMEIEGTCFVDASGDAALAYKSGLQTPMGRARDGKTQPMTLTFSTANADLARFHEAGGCAILGPLWESLRATHQWRNPRNGSALSCPTRIPGRPGELSWNVTRILVEKGTDARLLSEAEIEGRLQIEEFIEGFLRPHVPGFDKCFLSAIGKQVGVRETRRINGEYILQVDDLINCHKFPDAIACNSYPVDIHSPDGGSTEYRESPLPKGEYYTIPYRSLVAVGLDNLLASGRCLSASHEALSAVRVLSAAMATGEAAGTAAALCVRENVSAKSLSTVLLRETLEQAGAFIGRLSPILTSHHETVYP